jgi:hypothetical protein
MVRRLVTLGSLLIITPLGFASKYYNGPGAWWFNNYLGGVMYEIFWCLAVYLLWPRASALPIAIWVFALTCSLEFLQLWHPHFLQVIRGTFIGRTLIGTSFTWWDFPYYIAGCLAGWLWIRGLSQIRSADRI